jgi:hypothetical protein
VRQPGCPIGVNPVQALVVPHIIAATFVGLLLYWVDAVTGSTGSYIFAVFIQHVTPGAFRTGMTLVTGLPQVVISLIKATLFGLSAGLIACYKGLSVGGGPTGGGYRVDADSAASGRRRSWSAAMPQTHTCSPSCGHRHSWAPRFRMRCCT